MTHTLIADSGSTKTDWRLLNDKKQVISQYKTIGFNPYFQDSETIFQELAQHLLPNLNPDLVSKIHFYGTGITHPEKGEIVQKALKKGFKEAQIETYSDMVAAARATCGHQAGIACILGTGANSCQYDGEKISFQIPALGFWLGDEGSGGYLGKTLVKAYLLGNLPDDLKATFEKRFGALSRLEVLENAYQKPLPNRYFASFSKFLFDNRKHPFAYQLIYDAFQVFFKTYIVKYPHYQQQQVHFVGSVAFYYSDILRGVATDVGITAGHILESPISGLVLYEENQQ